MHLVFKAPRSTFQVIWHMVMWHDAQAHCHAIGGHLAAFEAEDEYSAIAAFVPRKSYHFGLNDIEVEGRYVWEHNGKAIGPHQSWAPNEPSGSDREDCGTMFAGEWGDLNCYDETRARHFMCEFETEQSSAFQPGVFTPTPLRRYSPFDALLFACADLQTLGVYYVSPNFTVLCI